MANNLCIQLEGEEFITCTYTIPSSIQNGVLSLNEKTQIKSLFHGAKSVVRVFIFGEFNIFAKRARKEEAMTQFPCVSFQEVRQYIHNRGTELIMQEIVLAAFSVISSLLIVFGLVLLGKNDRQQCFVIAALQSVSKHCYPACRIVVQSQSQKYSKRV